MTDTLRPFVAEDIVDIRTAAALLVTPDGRYLMQLRDDKAGIVLPNMWALFGGCVEANENPEAGLRRELLEELELELEPGSLAYFSQMAFDAIYSDGGFRHRYFFEASIDPGVVDSLVLHEGAEMRLMTADDIAREAFRFVPYDFTILCLHMLLQQDGVFNSDIGKAS
ncbi:MAG: NUDIX domain-containing protein [Alphaproteobacteria bacterium]|nr:NUDIX domain-containing protein [Alphaproteobacteria bacterium]